MNSAFNKSRDIEGRQSGGKDSLWKKAFWKFRGDRVGLIALSVVSFYGVIALGVVLGLLAGGWDELMTNGASGISAEHWFGTNVNGQDVLRRTLFSTKTAFEIGIVVAVFSTLLGAFAGCVSGYFSGTWIDELIILVYGCLDSIPFYLFVAAVAFAAKDFPYAMHVAMVATFWTSTARLVRGEVIKIKHQEYIEAVRAVGVSTFRILLRHVFPNTTHILLVQATLVFVLAIKSEVILSFLGLGVKEGISWGLMIAEASGEVAAGIFNNFLASSLFMFGLVMAFNLFSDALQDSLDPRKVSSV